MVQINTAGTTEMFKGAYNMRMMENRMREGAQAQQTQLQKTAKDTGIADVKLSEESAAFFANAGVRKAQAAAQTAATSEVSTDPFAETGDLKKQYLVFSEHLYNNGFYDSLSDDQVKEAEDLLKNITAGMDAISPNSLTATGSSAPTHAGAQMEFASSVQALEAFADKNLTGDLRTSFGHLIRSYVAHNDPIVSQHVSITDRRDQALANLPQTTVMGVLRGYPKDEATEAAAKKLGRIQFGKTQDNQIRKSTSQTFAQVREGKSTVDFAISKLRDSFLSYATDKSNDNSVRSLAAARNDNSFRIISAYWSAMVKMSLF